MIVSTPLGVLIPVSAAGDGGGLGTGLLLAVAVITPVVIGLAGTALRAWWRHRRRMVDMRRVQRRLEAEVSAQTRLPVAVAPETSAEHHGPPGHRSGASVSTEDEPAALD